MTIMFCLAKAEECEALAIEAVDDGRRRGWLLMSQDWLTAAAQLGLEAEGGDNSRAVATR